jgi:RimJ/RimL family protein N-acetyltransferase
MPAPQSIRMLTKADGPVYQELRLESLQVSPEAFLSLYETEVKLHEGIFADHLDWSYHPPYFGYFGIFLDETLAGYIQVNRTYLDKQNHMVILNNLYIGQNFRNQGFATVLVEHVLSLLVNHEHIERVYLSCLAKNTAALRFYKKLGFRRYGVRTRAVKWQGVYDDEIEMVKVVY